jgi:hypothetical protein
MPRVIDGRQLTAKEHRQWKKVRASARKSGLSDDRACAAATKAIQKTRRKKR